MGNAFRAAFFGKVADPQSAFSSQKIYSIANIF